MITITAKKIAELTGAELLRGDSILHGISTDSKSIKPGEAFLAIIGENHNAHKYLSEAASNGATALVISEPDAVNTIPENYKGSVILVPDTRRAYQDIAAYYKKETAPYTIAVTGSVGKTSLKDMIYCILQGNGSKVQATAGNYNNDIGLPQTILSMEEDTEVLVLEMGMNHSGEIRRLAEIARPDIAAITNIGLSHIENFEDENGIFKAKMEIASFFGEKETLVVNGDNKWLSSLRDAPDIPYKIIYCGESEKSEYRISHPEYNKKNELCFFLHHQGGDTEYQIPVPGLYAGLTAALATAAVSALGISPMQAAKSLRGLKRTAHRLELIKDKGINIIDDTYNSSPDSLQAAIDYLIEIAGSDGRKILVLAGMNELGAMTCELHHLCGVYAARAGVDEMITIGDKAKDFARGFKETNKNGTVKISDTNEDAAEYIKSIAGIGDSVLVKGSRAYRTEEIVDAMLRDKE